jgi:hypothetical protein
LRDRAQTNSGFADGVRLAQRRGSQFNSNRKNAYSGVMSTWVFYAIMLFTVVGVLYWKAIQQILLFRKNRKWTGRFVISAVWMSLVTINILLSAFNQFF